MNDETLEYLRGLIDRLDSAEHGMTLRKLEAYNLAYSLKHLLVNELRTDGRYALADNLEVKYGIR
jgi:hypothetical protein